MTGGSSDVGTSRAKPGIALRCILVVLGFLACIGGLNALARWAEGPDQFADWQDELDRAGSAEIVVLGPSVAQHIYPDAMCSNGINLAAPWQDIYEAEALIDHLSAADTLPRLVIIGRLPGHYSNDNGADGTSRGNRRIHTYRNLQARDDWRLIEDDWQGAVRAFAFPVLGHDQWQSTWRLFKSRLAGEDRDMPDPAYSQERLPDRRTDAALAQGFLAQRDRELSDMQKYDAAIAERSLRTALRLNARLRARGSQLVLVTMPVGPAMSAKAPSALADDLALTARIDGELEDAGAIVIDHLTGTPVSEHLANFRDAVHLNRDGGLAYSHYLATQLAALGVLPAPDCASPT